MTAIELERTIAQETRGLSWPALEEVVDFIRFLKTKEGQTREITPDRRERIQTGLATLEADSLAHLEAEFADYQERYPHE